MRFGIKDPLKNVFWLHSNSFDYHREQWSVWFEVTLPKNPTSYPLWDEQTYYKQVAVFSEPRELYSPRSGFKECEYGPLNGSYSVTAMNRP